MGSPDAHADVTLADLRPRDLTRLRTTGAGEVIPQDRDDRSVYFEDLDSAAGEPEYGLDDCECLFLAPGENLLDVFNLLGVGLGSYELEGGSDRAPK